MLAVGLEDGDELCVGGGVDEDCTTRAKSPRVEEVQRLGKEVKLLTKMDPFAEKKAQRGLGFGRDEENTGKVMLMELLVDREIPSSGRVGSTEVEFEEV